MLRQRHAKAARRPWGSSRASAAAAYRLYVVVELEFVGVGAKPELVEFGGALVVQPRGDEGLGEHAALGEEGVVGFQVAEHGLQGAGDLGDGGGLAGGQLVQVLVDRLGR